MDIQRSRRTASTSPVLVNLGERGKPVLFLSKGREESRKANQRWCGRGWEKAKAVLQRDGFGLKYHPARKRADFPAVSRHENTGRIEFIPIKPSMAMV